MYYDYHSMSVCVWEGDMGHLLNNDRSFQCIMNLINNITHLLIVPSVRNEKLRLVKYTVNTLTIKITHITHIPELLNIVGLAAQYPWAKCSMILSIFCPSPGRWKLLKNSLQQITKLEMISTNKQKLTGGHWPKTVPLVCAIQRVSSTPQYLGHEAPRGILPQQPYWACLPPCEGTLLSRLVCPWSSLPLWSTWCPNGG